MQSTRPYLIRAIYQWCVDQGFTPHIVAYTDSRTRVPAGYAKDNQIVLNLGPDATHKMSLENDFITFQARFNGVVQSLLIPVENVLAIYARENGHGMSFELELPGNAIESDQDKENKEEREITSSSPQSENATSTTSFSRGHLKVIK